MLCSFSNLSNFFYFGSSSRLNSCMSHYLIFLMFCSPIRVCLFQSRIDHCNSQIENVPTYPISYPRWRLCWTHRIQSWLRKQDGIQRHQGAWCCLRKTAQRKYQNFHFSGLIGKIFSQNQIVLTSMGPIYEK